MNNEKMMCSIKKYQLPTREVKIGKGTTAKDINFVHPDDLEKQLNLFSYLKKDIPMF